MASEFLIFFVEEVSKLLLQRFISYVRGEDARRHEMDVDISTIKGDVSEILEYLRHQMHQRYQVGIQFLRDASLCEVGSERYREYVKDALREFASCAEDFRAVGLPKARTLINKAVCHQFLGEHGHSVSDLSDARQIALEVASKDREGYIVEQREEGIETKLPNGKVVQGWRITKRSVPATKDGALALIDEIDDSLQAIRA